MSIEVSAIHPSVTVHDGWLRVVFDDGEHADYHLRWLRHFADEVRHPQTGERLRCSSELDDALSLRAARVRGDALELVWEPDGERSRHPFAWLRAHAYARGREAVPPPPSDADAVTLRDDGQGLDEVVRAALGLVASRGLAVVRRAGSAQTAPEDATEPLLAAFAAAGLDVVGTHFGRIEDLRTDNTTNTNTDQLGYTDAAVALHTDQPFLDRPPRYQLLQCIRQADAGGDNAVADARAAFAYLASRDAHAARLLRTVPVLFHRKQRAFERVVSSPIVSELDGHFLLRLSYFTVAPLQLPFAELEAWYRAHDRFVRLLRDPRHHYAVSLTPGDWLLYDNHRMAHARTAFRGARWVRGVYFEPGR